MWKHCFSFLAKVLQSFNINVSKWCCSAVAVWTAWLGCHFGLWLRWQMDWYVMGLFLEFLSQNMLVCLLLLNECIYEPLQPPSLCCSSCLTQELVDIVKYALYYSVILFLQILYWLCFFLSGMDFYCITLVFFFTVVFVKVKHSHISIYAKEFYCTSISLFWCLLKWDCAVYIAAFFSSTWHSFWNGDCCFARTM